MKKGGRLITPGWQTFAMHRVIGPTVNGMQRIGQIGQIIGNRPDARGAGSGKLGQRSTRPTVDRRHECSVGPTGWRERVGGKKTIEHGGTRRHVGRRWRWKALSGGGRIHRARQPTDLGGGGGAGGQRAGNARARAGAGSKPSGPQQFSPLSQPRMDRGMIHWRNRLI